MKIHRQELRLLMAQYDLKCYDVARLLGKSYRTVRTYCGTVGVDIPESELERLKSLIGHHSPATSNKVQKGCRR